MARKKKVTPGKSLALPADYRELLESLKARIRQAQTKAMLSVNRELIRLYWDIGRRIVEQQSKEGWGKGVVDRLAGDLQKAFPGIGGFSASNVSRMRAFYLAYAATGEISARAVPKLADQRPTVKKSARAVPKMAQKRNSDHAQTEPPSPLGDIPWGHNIVLLFKLSDRMQRLWYAAKTLEHGWSRAVLTVQIEGDLFGRQGKAITNFSDRLPAPQSDLAQQSLKDPYLFDFLTLHEEAVERDLEAGLVEHIQNALRDIAKPIGVAQWQTRLVQSLPETLKGSLPSIEEIEAEFGKEEGP